ncbi:hypothetical protein FQA39_LY11202 [Lamprigera yunnana]|nr:hypothetical protein FQA39_LY11202 [Lamprigera yunnana]
MDIYFVKTIKNNFNLQNLSYPIDFELFGSGKIKLYNNCKIYADSVVIFFDNLPYLENNYNSILPNFNILHDDCCKKHSQHNIDKISIPKIHLNKLDLEELKIASHKLDDIARLSENLSKTENTSRKNSVFSIIVQIVCGILITYLIFKVVVFLVNRIRNKKNPHDHNNTSKVVGVAGIALQQPHINYENCLLGIIIQNFEEEETLYFITSESYDITPLEKVINPYVVVDMNKPIQLERRIARHFIISTKNEDSLGKLLPELKNSAVWSKSYSAKGKFVIVTFTNQLSTIFCVLWSHKIIDAVVLVPSFTNDHTLYTANPFVKENNCGNTPTVITKQSCSAPVIKSVEIPLKSLGGCKFYYLKPPKDKNPLTSTIMFLLTELAKSLNGSLAFDEKLLLQVDYPIAFMTFFNYPFSDFDNSKLIYQQDWLWIAPPPIRIFPIESISTLFQIEVWLLTGFMFIFTIIVWWIAVSLKTSPNFSQFCHVSINVVSLTLSGTVNTMPKMKILRYVCFIYSIYFLIIQTAFNTNLLYGLTSPGYKDIVTKAEQLLDLELPLCADKNIDYKEKMISYSSDTSTFHKIKELITKCDCHPHCFDLIYDYRNMSMTMLKYHYYLLKQSDKRHFQTFIDSSVNGNLQYVFIVEKGHFFVKNINAIITMLQESGIYQHQIKNFHPTLKEDEIDGSPVPLSIEHMSFTFILLTIGLSLSFLVFIIECLYDKYHNRF